MATAMAAEISSKCFTSSLLKSLEFPAALLRQPFVTARPSLAHLGLDLLHFLGATDADLVLMFLEAFFSAPPPGLIPAQSLAASALQ